MRIATSNLKTAAGHSRVATAIAKLATAQVISLLAAMSSFQESAMRLVLFPMPTHANDGAWASAKLARRPPIRRLAPFLR